MNKTELSKQYQLSFEDRGQYLFARISGEKGSLEIATAYWTEIAQQVIKTGKKKVLVIEDIPEVISVAEVHQLVTDLADLPVKDVTIAFVDTYAEHASLNEFGVLVSENRGFTVKACETEEEAETWLLDN